MAYVSSNQTPLYFQCYKCLRLRRSFTKGVEMKKKWFLYAVLDEGLCTSGPVHGTYNNDSLYTIFVVIC